MIIKSLSYSRMFTFTQEVFARILYSGLWLIYEAAACQCAGTPQPSATTTKPVVEQCAVESSSLAKRCCQDVSGHVKEQSPFYVEQRADDTTHTSEEKDFRPLFNGRDLTGWHGKTKGYVVENKILVCLGTSGSGNLFTDHEYSNFVLKFDFKISVGANNGLGIRVPDGTSRVSFDGMELQILDDSAPRYKNLSSYQYHGSLYGYAPAKRGALKPPDEWNEQEVRCDGRVLVVKLNGVTILDTNLDHFSADSALDGHERPGIKRSTGHIALLGHNDRVEFRNIRIKTLP